MKKKVKKIPLIFNNYYRFIIPLWLWFIPQTNMVAQKETSANLIRVFDLQQLPVQLKKPSAMMVSLYGDIFIIDAAVHLTVKLDPNGQYVTHTGGFGWNEHQLDTPADIASHDGLNIYVADYQNRRIQRYNRHLQYISSLGKTGITAAVRTELDIGYPAALTLSPLGDLFVVNQENNTVMKISASGNLTANFGGFESGRGRLHRPFRIRSTRDQIYLLDDRRIVLFDYFGNYLSEWTHPLLKKPCDFAIDRQGLLFIIQQEYPAILVFRSDGRLENQWLNYEFQDPSAIAWASGRIYVLDRLLMKIAVFQIPESR